MRTEYLSDPFYGDTSYYCDTMDGRHKSLDGNKYAQVVASKNFFAVAYPMEAKSGAGDAFQQFVLDYGRPENLTSDGSREQAGIRTSLRMSASI